MHVQLLKLVLPVIKSNVYSTHTESTDGVRERRSVTGPKYTVELHPMEIRTFKMAIHF